MIKRWSHRPAVRPEFQRGVIFANAGKGRQLRHQYAFRFTSRRPAPDSSSQREKPFPLTGPNPADWLIIFPQRYFSREEVP